MEPAVSATALWVVIALVALALAFGFMNGFHDAPNSIAAIVSTGVLKPGQAVLWAAGFNFLALGMFSLSVASTVANMVDSQVIDFYVIFGALAGAIAWNIVSSYYGMLASSSHALIGGVIGATIAKAGTGALDAIIIGKTALFVFVAPALGFALGALVLLMLSWMFRRSTQGRTDRWLRRGQLLSSALYSLGHGGNDAQKTMGIIWLLFIAAGMTTNDSKSLPFWVVVSAYAAISLGTLFGGWRIVKSMGQRITKLKPLGGFCAETGGAITLFIASSLGIPVSTTHTITGAIVGVGAARKLSAVRWGLAGNIVWAWVLTIPASAFIAAIAWWAGRQVF